MLRLPQTKKCSRHLAWLPVLALMVLSSCSPPKGSFAGNPTTGSTSASYLDYVVIANNTTKTVNLYTPELVFVRTVLTLGSTDIPTSLAKFDDNNILVAIEGGASAQDRVIKVNLNSSNDYVPIIQDAVNFTGTTVRGIARLTGGDILASDSATVTNHLERYTADTSSPTALWNRISIGWPLSLQASATSIGAGPTNSFVLCSNGASDLIRTYNNAGTQVGTASATLPLPSLGSAHDVNGCAFDPSGRVAALYNGTNDSLRVYTNTNLTAIAWTYTDLTRFNNPQALAVRSNGNFLVAEFVTPNDFVIEVSSTGSYVNTYRPVGTATITDIMVMK